MSNENQRKQVYNPVEVKLWMRKIERGDSYYYIGNSDMDISLLDTVLKFIPPRDGEKSGFLIINNVKDKSERQSNNAWDDDGYDED